MEASNIIQSIKTELENEEVFGASNQINEVYKRLSNANKDIIDNMIKSFLPENKKTPLLKDTFKLVFDHYAINVGLIKTKKGKADTELTILKLATILDYLHKCEKNTPQFICTSLKDYDFKKNAINCLKRQTVEEDNMEKDICTLLHFDFNILKTGMGTIEYIDTTKISDILYDRLSPSEKYTDKRLENSMEKYKDMLMQYDIQIFKEKLVENYLEEFAARNIEAHINCSGCKQYNKNEKNTCKFLSARIQALLFNQRDIEKELCKELNLKEGSLLKEEIIDLNKKDYFSFDFYYERLNKGNKDIIKKLGYYMFLSEYDKLSSDEN